MNKKSVLISLLLTSLIFTISFGNSADPVLNVSVNILKPSLIVEISPEEISLGNVMPGYDGNPSNITFTNKGEMDVRLYPRLESGAEDFFNYLKFSKDGCSTWHNFSYYNSTRELLSINKPNILNGERTGGACIRLELSDYKKSINPGLKSAEITFLVMSDE
jgi:hypothetical protein